ncbi:PREDICTED: putative 57 kDa heat shock protein [Camelina sativa]|uniref:57 kDa heat shock protein n=1 Tax=Camelina sativa TaxID=90675 RepID=A0ABM0US49_CAMSA|nr:PREDICTED: putative 57 kDa heat shock protein [Camelina sativa]
MAMAVPLIPQPQSPEGFYAINNQFLTHGPKGFSEFTMLENADLFVRMDLPGVPEEGVSVSLERSKKAVVVYAEAPKVQKHDSTDRQYVTMTGLVCRCCEISRVTTHMSDGVLRLVLSKTPIFPQRSSCIAFLRGRGLPQDLRGSGTHRFPHGRIGTDPNDPALTGPVLQPHPWVIPISVMAYESKQLQNGKLYVRVDMPGVPKENFTVSVTNGRVKVTGEAPAVSHDSGGRFYSGDVAMLSAPVDIPSRRVKTIAKNGVIRLLIPPV